MHLRTYSMVVPFVQPCVENGAPLSERRIAEEEVWTRSIFKENNTALFWFRMVGRMERTRIHLRPGNIRGK